MQRAPTREECINAAAEVILRAAIRIEGERAAAWSALGTERRGVLSRTEYGCWVPETAEQLEARRRCDEPRCVYPPHLDRPQ